MQARRFALSGICWVGLMAALVAGWGLPTAMTQETPAAAESAAAPESPAGGFDELYAQLKDHIGRLRELQQQYKLAKPEDRAGVETEFNDLLATAEALEPQVAAAAEKEFLAAQGKDEAAGEFLAAMAEGDYATGRYPSAFARAKLLAENGYENMRMHDLAGRAAFYAEDFPACEQHLKIAQENNALSPEGKKCLDEAKIREAEKQADDLPRVKISTNKGDLVVELFENEAPNTVANFVSLVEAKFYDGLTFHRVIDGFMAQGGCPRGDGSGGPGYQIACECYQPNYRKHFTGSLSMAHAGRDTGGSQFFITFVPTDHLDGVHTVFGRVIEGLDVLPKLQRRDPQDPLAPEPDKILSATVIRKRDHPYEPEKLPER